jgi:cystathionine beta-lyase family protein involved in aluminum resistance
MIELLCETFDIDRRVREAAQHAFERTCRLKYPTQDRVKARVFRAFYDEGINDSDLAGTTGYGYDDAARERYESLLSRVLDARCTLARLSIVSGTHAIVAALAACVAPGERLIAAAGRPYDTLRNAICDADHSLVAQGVRYEEVALREDGSVDLDAIAEAASARNAAAVFVQRSRGYAPRPSLDIAACARIVARVKDVAPSVVVLVDNCYGELVEEHEPTSAGADLIMGSLIKNLGGGLAPGGGYIAGRSDLVERASARLYAPGLRSGVGPTLGFGRAFVQGLFVAPMVVEQTLRGLDFAAALFAELGFAVDPQPGAVRSDIVQAIRLHEPELLLRFAAGLQKAMPLNARFRPEPGPVPGYVDPVVMSSGAFVGGATIELSCDAPLRAPFEVYLQGGIVSEHTMLGALLAAQAVISN